MDLNLKIDLNSSLCLCVSLSVCLCVSLCVSVCLCLSVSLSLCLCLISVEGWKWTNLSASLCNLNQTSRFHFPILALLLINNLQTSPEHDHVPKISNIFEVNWKFTVLIKWNHWNLISNPTNAIGLVRFYTAHLSTITRLIWNHLYFW